MLKRMEQAPAPTRIQQLAEIFAKRVLDESSALDERESALKKAKTELEDERAKMQAFIDPETAGRDIVSINVGGKIMSTKRQTLLLVPGSMLEAIFSGRWERSLQRDSEGRVFIDYTPAVFQLLLSHLRVTRDKLPDKAPVPKIPEELKAEFGSMLEFLGMHEFVFGSTPTYTFSSFPSVSRGISACDNNVFKKFDSQQCMYFSQKVALSTCAKVVSWNITIKVAAQWFFLGVIGATEFSTSPAQDPTAFGWSNNAHAWLRGVPQGAKGGWSGWKNGQKAFFTLDLESHSLLMEINSQSFTLSLSGAPMQDLRICIGMCTAGTELALAS